MGNAALISVVITTYKRSFQLLKKAIFSVQNQTYSPVEIIVVNDTPDSAPEYEEVTKHISQLNVVYIATGVNQGACAARNAGLKVAKGEWIAFLDDDDEWHPQKLEKQMSLVQHDTVLVSCQTQTRLHAAGGECKIINVSPCYPHILSRKKLMLGNICGGTSCPLIRRESLLRVGGFTVGLPALQDYECWLRLSKQGAMMFYPEPLVFWNIYQQDSITQNPQKRIAGIQYILENYTHETPDERADLVFCMKCNLMVEYSKLNDKISFFKTFKYLLCNMNFSFYKVTKLAMCMAKSIKHIK